MEPVPWEVKLAFHIYGAACFISGLVLTIFTIQGIDCRVSTTGLYYYSVAVAVLAVVCSVVILIMIPFWIVNRVCRNRVLDRRNRDGVCYEPVACCSCLWHI